MSAAWTVVLHVLCLFVQGGIAACSPFVSPQPRFVSRFFHMIVDAPNLGIQRVASFFFSLCALIAGELCRWL
jgi:hypothetical protein